MPFRTHVNLIHLYDSRQETPQATTEDPAATIQLAQQRNLGALSAFNGLEDSRPSNTAFGFPSGDTTANHRGPSSYYPISTAEKPRSSVSFQWPLGLTPIQYSFEDSRLETPQPTTEDPAATIQLAQQRNLGALSAFNGL